MSLLFFSFTFLLVWWVVLFAVLPFGVKTTEVQEGNANSAPDNPHLVKKFIITTLIALAITSFGFWLVNAGYIDLRAIIDISPPDNAS